MAARFPQEKLRFLAVLTGRCAGARERPGQYSGYGVPLGCSCERDTKRGGLGKLMSALSIFRLLLRRSCYSHTSHIVLAIVHAIDIRSNAVHSIGFTVFLSVFAVVLFQAFQDVEDFRHSLFDG